MAQSFEWRKLNYQQTNLLIYINAVPCFAQYIANIIPASDRCTSRGDNVWGMRARMGGIDKGQDADLKLCIKLNF